MAFSATRQTPAMTAGSCSTELTLDTSMHGDDATRHVVITTVDEAGILHHLEQGFLVWMFPDGLSEIPVAIGIVRNDLAHSRQRGK